MKVMAKNIRPYGKFTFRCVECNKIIVIDQQRFLEEPKEIMCKCGHNHIIKDWKPRKGGMNLNTED